MGSKMDCLPGRPHGRRGSDQSTASWLPSGTANGSTQVHFAGRDDEAGGGLVAAMGVAADGAPEGGREAQLTGAAGTGMAEPPGGSAGEAVGGALAVGGFLGIEVPLAGLSDEPDNRAVHLRRDGLEDLPGRIGLVDGAWPRLDVTGSQRGYGQVALGTTGKPPCLLLRPTMPGWRATGKATPTTGGCAGADREFGAGQWAPLLGSCCNISNGHMLHPISGPSW